MICIRDKMEGQTNLIYVHTKDAVQGNVNGLPTW